MEDQQLIEENMEFENNELEYLRMLMPEEIVQGDIEVGDGAMISSTMNEVNERNMRRNSRSPSGMQTRKSIRRRRIKSFKRKLKSMSEIVLKNSKQNFYSIIENQSLIEEFISFVECLQSKNQ